MNELENVEKELSELRSRLEESFGVLDSLTQIQAQFEELAQTYQQFKEYADRAKTSLENTAQLEERFDRRLTELDTVIEERLKEVRDELSDVQNELVLANGELSEQFKQKLDNLESQVEDKFTPILQEWASQREAMQTPLKEFEARLDQLDNRTHIARLSLHNLENQVRTLRTWLIVAVLTAIASVGVSIWTLQSSKGSNPKSLSSSLFHSTRISNIK